MPRDRQSTPPSQHHSVPLPSQGQTGSQSQQDPDAVQNGSIAKNQAGHRRGKHNEQHTHQNRRKSFPNRQYPAQHTRVDSQQQQKHHAIEPGQIKIQAQIPQHHAENLQQPPARGQTCPHTDGLDYDVIIIVHGVDQSIKMGGKAADEGRGSRRSCRGLPFFSHFRFSNQ